MHNTFQRHCRASGRHSGFSYKDFYWGDMRGINSSNKMFLLSILFALLNISDPFFSFKLVSNYRLNNYNDVLSLKIFFKIYTFAVSMAESKATLQV